MHRHQAQVEEPDVRQGATLAGHGLRHIVMARVIDTAEQGTGLEGGGDWQLVSRTGDGRLRYRSNGGKNASSVAAGHAMGALSEHGIQAQAMARL